MSDETFVDGFVDGYELDGDLSDDKEYHAAKVACDAFSSLLSKNPCAIITVGDNKNVALITHDEETHYYLIVRESAIDPSSFLIENIIRRAEHGVYLTPIAKVIELMPYIREYNPKDLFSELAINMQWELAKHIASAADDVIITNGSMAKNVERLCKLVNEGLLVLKQCGQQE